MGPPTFLAYGHDSPQYSPLDLWIGTNSEETEQPKVSLSAEELGLQVSHSSAGSQYRCFYQGKNRCLQKQPEKLPEGNGTQTEDKGM